MAADGDPPPGFGPAVREPGKSCGEHETAGLSAVTTADKPWKRPDASQSPGEQVYAQLLEDYPPEAIQWVKKARWEGPALVSTSDIDM